MKVKRKIRESELHAFLFVLGFVALSWGALTFPVTFKLTTFQYTMADTVFLLVGGWCLCFLSLKMHKTWRERKWYESLKRG